MTERTPRLRRWGRRGLLVGLLLGAYALAFPIGPSLLSAAPPLGTSATAERTGQGSPAPFAVERTADGRDVVAGRIVVGFQPGVSDVERETVHRAAMGRAANAPSGGVPSVRAAPVKNLPDTVQTVDVTDAPSLESVIASYLADPRVRYAEPDYVVHALDVPNDQYFGSQYGMTKVQAPAAWGVTHGSATVKIAILDCGIYEAHPDLVGKVVARQDFTGSPNGTDDQCNHGTHVAGIASANTNNTTGVAGLGYDTKLMNGKILSDSGAGYDTQIAQGIHWAADNGANVISMSLGGAGSCSQTFQDAIDYAWGKNVVVVAAAGNSASNGPFQPADCAHAVAVASTDASDAKSDFSNFGSWVALAAPGSAIYSTVNPNLNGGEGYTYLSGTSMATPHVAALAALIWSTRSGASAQAVVQRMESTADRIAGTGSAWQYGRINAMAAVAPSVPAPAATALAPTAGATAGAVPVKIRGASFQPGATVTFGGVAGQVVAVTQNEIAVLTPAHGAGSVDVVVTNPDGQSQTMASAFTYIGVPDSRPGPSVPVSIPAPSPVARPAPPSATTGGTTPAPAPAPIPVPRG